MVKPHAHLQTLMGKYVKFQRNRTKTLGLVALTKYTSKSVTYGNTVVMDKPATVCFPEILGEHKKWRHHFHYSCSRAGNSKPVDKPAYQIR